MGKHKEEKNICDCNEECTCGENCNCTIDNKCSEDCTCGEACDCGDECHCNEECDCGCDCTSAENNELIEDLNNQIINLKEALLRNQAELQNYKRRKEEETERILKYKNEDILKELLGVVDNFERAIKMDQ